MKYFMMTLLVLTVATAAFAGTCSVSSKTTKKLSKKVAVSKIVK